jgi:hypothetical protein
LQYGSRDTLPAEFEFESSEFFGKSWVVPAGAGEHTSQDIRRARSKLPPDHLDDIDDMDDIMRRWVMNVGACYYVGATMASAIEDVLGREQLVKSLVDVDALFRVYDEAAQTKGLPRLEGM